MAEAFDKTFPQYLAMGMTAQQYWEQDCTLVIPYREAYRIKQENENNYAWLQGMYVYEAILDASPILHAFAKSGTRARPYPERPYDFRPKKKDETPESNQVKMDNAAAFMMSVASRFNAQHARKKESLIPDGQ